MPLGTERKPNPTRIALRVQNTSYEEGPAGTGQDIYPGMLVALQADGTYLPHDDEAEFWPVLEDALQGRTIRDKYAEGDRLFMGNSDKGDIYYLRLAEGENVAVADPIKSNGDGFVAKGTGATDAIGIALEAVDLSASDNTVSPFVRVRMV